MVELLRRADMLFRYVKQNKTRVFTLMDVKPQQGLVERECMGLGVKVYNAGHKKDCYIDLKQYKESDVRHRLVLGYYSMGLCAVFLPEGCLASLILSRGGSFKIDELSEKGEKFHELFAFEHFFDKGNMKAECEHMIEFFVGEKVLQVSEDKTTVSAIESKPAHYALVFFKELIHSLVDTYLLTLLTIEQINGKPMVLPIRKLIRELHASAKELYTES